MLADLCAALITHLIRSNEPDIASQESIKKDSELVGAYTSMWRSTTERGA